MLPRFCVLVFLAGGHLTDNELWSKVLHDAGSGTYSGGSLLRGAARF